MSTTLLRGKVSCTDWKGRRLSNDLCRSEVPLSCGSHAHGRHGCASPILPDFGPSRRKFGRLCAERCQAEFGRILTNCNPGRQTTARTWSHLLSLVPNLSVVWIILANFGPMLTNLDRISIRPTFAKLALSLAKSWQDRAASGRGSVKFARFDQTLANFGQNRSQSGQIWARFGHVSDVCLGG